jgi:hypothetical protein
VYVLLADVMYSYGTEWFVLFGGATCGVAASALWAAEGAIALGYADIHDRGKFSTSIFLISVNAKSLF